MTDLTDLTERLHRERDALSITDVEEGLSEVRAIARRRRRRTSVLGVAAVGGVLLAGVGFVGSIDGDQSEFVVTGTAPLVTDAAVPRPSAPAVTSSAPDPTETTTAPDTASVSPSVGERVLGRAVDGEMIEVTDGLRSIAGDDFFPTWTVPWDGGFLAGGVGSETEPITAYVSPDGETWEAIDLTPGIRGPQQPTVTVADGRLVMLGGLVEAGWERPAIATTTDLVNWTISEIPVEAPPADLPAYVRAFTWPDSISANADGWIATVQTTWSLDTTVLAEQRTGRVVTSASEAWSDEGILVTIDPEAGGEGTEDIWILWSEVEDDIGADLTAAVRNGEPVEVWTGGWDGTTPIRTDDPAVADLLGWNEPLISVENGFVALQRNDVRPGDDSGDNVRELRASVDGGPWTVLETPIAERVEYVFPLDGDLGVVAEADDATITIYRVDVAGETWTPIVVPGLPRTMNDVQSSGTAALYLDASFDDRLELENRSLVQTFEQNGLRLSWTYDDFISSYEVTSIETGDVVVAERLDLRDVEGSFDLSFVHLTGGLDRDITIVDPETAEVLMDIALDEMQAANPREPYVGPEPEPWIVATSDGVSWFVHELPPSDPDQDMFYAEELTVSGGRLLYHTDAARWFVVDLS